MAKTMGKNSWMSEQLRELITKYVSFSWDYFYEHLLFVAKVMHTYKIFRACNMWLNQVYTYKYALSGNAAWVESHLLLFFKIKISDV